MSMPVRADRVARYLELIEREAETLEEMGQRVAEGEGLMAICAAWDVPYARVMGWLMADAKRYEVYRRALEVAAHAEVAEALVIADTPQMGEIRKIKSDGTEEITQEDMLGHRKLRVETRFRRAKHHAPKVYGESDVAGKVLPQVTIAIGVRVGAADAGRVIEDAEGDI